MTHLYIKLTAESYDFVQSRVESGRYENANDLVWAALRALHREESAREANRKSNVIAETDIFRKLWEVSAEASLVQN